MPRPCPLSSSAADLSIFLALNVCFVSSCPCPHIYTAVPVAALPGTAHSLQPDHLSCLYFTPIQAASPPDLPSSSVLPSSHWAVFGTYSALPGYPIDPAPSVVPGTLLNLFGISPMPRSLLSVSVLRSHLVTFSVPDWGPLFSPYASRSVSTLPTPSIQTSSAQDAAWPSFRVT